MFVKTIREPAYAIEHLTRTQIGWLIVALRNTLPQHHSLHPIDEAGRRFTAELLDLCEHEVRL